MAARTVLLMVSVKKDSWIQEIFHELMGHNFVYRTDERKDNPQLWLGQLDAIR